MNIQQLSSSSATTETPPLIAVLTVPNKVKWLPRRSNGKPISASSVLRWALHGLHGVKLRTLRVGGTLCTSEAWLREFFEALAAADEQPNTPVVRTLAARNRSLSHAQHQLATAGFEL